MPAAPRGLPPISAPKPSAPSKGLMSVESSTEIQDLFASLTKDLGPLAILGGDSVAEVAERLLRALPIGTGEAVQALLPRVSPGGSNGSAKRRTGD